MAYAQYIYTTYGLSKPSVKLYGQVLSFVTDQFVRVFEPRQEDLQNWLDWKRTNTESPNNILNELCIRYGSFFKLSNLDLKIPLIRT